MDVTSMIMGHRILASILQETLSPPLFDEVVKLGGTPYDKELCGWPLKAEGGHNEGGHQSTASKK